MGAGISSNIWTQADLFHRLVSLSVHWLLIKFVYTLPLLIANCSQICIFFLSKQFYLSTVMEGHKDIPSGIHYCFPVRKITIPHSCRSWDSDMVFWVLEGKFCFRAPPIQQLILYREKRAVCCLSLPVLKFKQRGKIHECLAQHYKN